MRLNGKFAIVTGGGSGIGAATARLFAAEGAHVAILERNFPHAEEEVGRILEAGGTAAAWQCDVSNSVQVRVVISEVVRKFGAPHVLFNNAGIAIRQTVGDSEPEDWDRVMETNVPGGVSVLEVLLASFRPGGREHYSFGVCNRHHRSAKPCSAFRREGRVDCADPEYGSRLCQSWYPRELHLSGFRSNSPHSCPARRSGANQAPDRDASVGPAGRTRRYSQRRPFLASSDSAWITGISLVVDGGFSAGKTDEV